MCPRPGRRLYLELSTWAGPHPARCLARAAIAGLAWFLFPLPTHERLARPCPVLPMVVCAGAFRQSAYRRYIADQNGVVHQLVIHHHTTTSEERREGKECEITGRNRSS